MARSIGLVILFQRRHYGKSIQTIAERFDDFHVVLGAQDFTIYESADDLDGPSIQVALDDDPQLLAKVIEDCTRLAPERQHAAIARCDAMIVARWDDEHDVADLSLEVCYLESPVQGILYYARIGEVSEGSFRDDAGVAALVPISDAELAQRLVGAWRLDPDVPCRVGSPGALGMTITPSGDLVYSERKAGGVTRILLTYEIVGGELVTDQPSKPSKVRSPIALGNDDRIYLRDLGAPCTFVRDEEPLDPDAALAALVGFALRHGVSTARPGGAMSPFVVVESPEGKRTLVRFADAPPDSPVARAQAEQVVAGLREKGEAAMCAFATDAVLATEGQRVEAIVVEGSRLGRAGALAMGLAYVDDGQGGARPEGAQIALPAVARGWL